MFQTASGEIRPWFEPGFDKDIKANIEKHWPQDATLICHEEAHRWADILLKNNPDCNVALCDGTYQSVLHTWLEIDGHIFDPTAMQFDGAINQAFYAAYDSCEGLDIVQRLAWWQNRKDSANSEEELSESPGESPHPAS